jgi:hypothetical protein
MAQFILRGDACRPMRDERCADAAFVVEVLEETEGCVFREGPAFAAEPVGVGF